MGNSRYCIFTILMTQLPTAFIHGLTMVSLNSAAPAIEDFIRKEYQMRYNSSASEATAMLYLTLAQSANVWGCIIGAMCVSQILRICSPKRSMLLAHSINLVAVVVSAPIAYYTGSYESLITGRFISGIARGLGFAITTVLVAETSVRSRLGFYVSPFQVCVSVAAAIGSGLGHGKVLGQPDLWVWLVSIPAFASIAYIISYPWLPESPVYHLRHQEDKKAENLLRRLRTPGENIIAERQILKKEVEEESQRKPVAIMTMMKSPVLRWQFIVATLVMHTIQLAGTQPVMMYSDAMLLRAGVNPAHVTYVTMVNNGQVLIAFPLYYFLERAIGTRRVYIIGITIAAIGVLTFTISNGLQENIPSMSTVAAVSMIVMMFGMHVGPILTLQSLPSELTTSATRPTVTHYSGLMYFIVAAITAIVFPYSVNAFGVYAYVPYVVFSVAYILFGIFCVPDTHLQTNTQIQQSLRRKSEIFSVSKQSKYPKSINSSVPSTRDL